MITLTLLHPTQSIPVQSWAFESESVVRIGRSNDNDVIIYSAVVSRHHVELWNNPAGWEIINFGANGTYVEDKPITQMSVVDGMVIRLGNSGPKIRIRVGAADPKTRFKMPSKDAASRETTPPVKEKQTFLTRRPPQIEDDETEADDSTTQLDFNDGSTGRGDFD